MASPRSSMGTATARGRTRTFGTSSACSGISMTGREVRTPQCMKIKTSAGQKRKGFGVPRTTRDPAAGLGQYRRRCQRRHTELPDLWETTTRGPRRDGVGHGSILPQRPLVGRNLPPLHRRGRTTATRRSGRHARARGGHRDNMANDRVLRPDPARRGWKRKTEARRVEHSGLMRHRPGPSRGHGQKMLGEEPTQRGGAQMATCTTGPRAPRKRAPRLGQHGAARRAGHGVVADREVPHGPVTDKFDVRPGCGRWQCGRCGDQRRTGQQQVSSSQQTSDLTATAWAACPQLYRRLPAILAGGQMPGATTREQW
jgi:hypothetical protein